MIAALDTNIFAYAEGVNEPERRAEARALLGAVQQNSVVPALVYAELFRVLTRRGRRMPGEARAIVLEWQSLLPMMAQQPEWVLAAVDLAAEHRLGIWDAAILDAAADAGCAVLLTEDLQHGFRWRGVTVVNPFLRPAHPLLAALLAAS